MLELMYVLLDRQGKLLLGAGTQGLGRLSPKDAFVSCSTVAVTQQDTNRCSQHRAGVRAVVDISRSSDRWAVFRWSRVGTAHSEGLGAARVEHRGEDIPEGQPDERRGTPHVQETMGAERKPIPARCQLSCWQ